MIKYLVKKIFGTNTERELKRMAPTIAKINAMEPHMASLSDDQLKAFTPKFRGRCKQGETLEELLPEVFREYTLWLAVMTIEVYTHLF